ncbi:hypothetical protein BHM03_00007114 [Ensete ventricosum]|nr:hypothetical protein BHM03_00007114 [Ensete ventricosum]
MNQRTNDVHKVIRMKDKRGETPLCGSPFIQEIQDTPIPQHFRLPTLEAYDGGSDPMEHVVAFRARMALYGTLDAIMCQAFPTTLRGTAASLLGMRQKEEEPLGRYLARFTKEIGAIPNSHSSLVIQAFMIRITPSHLFWSLVERPPMTMPEMLQRANQYVIAEALVAEKCKDQKRPRAKSSRGPPPGLSRKRM